MKNFQPAPPLPAASLLAAKSEETPLPAIALTHEQLHEAIAGYAAEMAGTILDLDPGLESVAIASWPSDE